MPIRIETAPPSAGTLADDADRAPLDRWSRQRLIGRVADLVTATAARPELGLAPDAAAAARAAVEAFFALYGERPVRDNKGGSGFNDSLWIFVLARLLDPLVIVESGVHRGHSTWLLRRACPQAEVHCFDPDLGRLVYRDREARYHERDWMEVPLTVAPASRSLVFFDDHINQALRLRQAHERGFRHCLFDDNFAAYNLYATGGPPVPTLAMARDPTLEPGREIAWVRNGKTYRYRYLGEDLHGAPDLIADYLELPDLAPVTRFSPGSALTFVRNRSSKS